VIPRGEGGIWQEEKRELPAEGGSDEKGGNSSKNIEEARADGPERRKPAYLLKKGKNIRGEEGLGAMNQQVN